MNATKVDFSSNSDDFVIIYLSPSPTLPSNMQRGFIYVGNGYIAGERVLMKHFIKHLINGTTDRIKSIIVKI